MIAARWPAYWDCRPSRADCVALIRPRLAALGLVVVFLTYLVGGGPLVGGLIAALMVGSAAALFGASVLNQVLERETDALMRRTALRPIPTGRVAPVPAAVGGLVLTGFGLFVLGAAVNPITAVVTAVGWLIYVGAYTPLKTRSSLATVVGAIPGAVPVLMGWAAATGSLGLGAWVLFAVLFLWQLPHFLAIAWMYRSDYRRAGLKMLPGEDTDGAATARQVFIYGVALVPVSLIPTLLNDAGGAYFFGALALGSLYLYFGVRMGSERSGVAARRLLKASVAYLPLLLALLVADNRIL